MLKNVGIVIQLLMPFMLLFGVGWTTLQGTQDYGFYIVLGLIYVGQQICYTHKWGD